MAPLMKPRRTPQNWRKESTAAATADLTPRQGGATEMLDVLLPQSTTPAAAKHLQSIRTAKKMPPAPDASETVLDEYMSTQRERPADTDRDTVHVDRHTNPVSRTPDGTASGVGKEPEAAEVPGPVLPYRRSPDRLLSPSAPFHEHRSGSRRRSSTGGADVVEPSADGLQTGSRNPSRGRSFRERSRSFSPYSSDRDEHGERHRRRRDSSISRSSSSPFSPRSREFFHCERLRTSSPRSRTTSAHHREGSRRRRSYDEERREYSRGSHSRDWRPRSPRRASLSPSPRRSSLSGRLLGGSALHDEDHAYSSRGMVDPAYRSSMTRTARLFCGLPMNHESSLRQERRTREIQREEDSANRTRSGKKPYHVNVNWEGKPYGLGVTTFNDALAKLVRGLDPSYVDIRQQPHHNKEILMRRLDDDFDYSAPLNPTYLRQRIGNALSSYRHEIIRLIQGEQERPPWVSETVWDKLVKLEGSEKFRTKSMQMKYANACRKNKGRTGPLGAAGITERLRQQLQRSPTADEIFEEMNRDKGYSGRSRRSSTSQPLRSTAERDCESEGNMPQESSADIQEQPLAPASTAEISEPLPTEPQSPPPASEHLPVPPPPPTTSVHSDASPSPLIAILERQISELKSCAIGETEEGVSLILTLECRLDAMRNWPLSSSGSRAAAVAQESMVSHVRDSAPVPPESSPPPTDPPQDCTNLRADLCNDSTSEPTEPRKEPQKRQTKSVAKKAPAEPRKSGRPSKPKVRDF